MFASRSGWLGPAKFSWIEGVLIKSVVFVKLGSAQPRRQAKAAIQKESPLATAALNV